MDVAAPPRPPVEAPAPARPTAPPFRVPETGVYAVNARGELALVVEPLAAGLKPTLVRMRGNRLAILSGTTAVNVRGYEERAVEVATRRGEALVVEVDVATQTAVRATPVPIEGDDGR